ncbi:MAG TPA: HAD family phosphatase [Thermoanaerobaculia bacterium]|nr:HAD family phosphatase [Thermoanaerobaculia bacterium]
MVRAALLDFNGVLVDDEPIHMRLFQRVVAEEGAEAFSEKDYWRLYAGLDDRATFRALLTRSGEAADETRLMRLIARKSSYYQEEIRHRGYPFFPGAAEAVGALAAAGLHLGIVSGALRDEVEGALGQAGLRSAFKVLVTAEDVAAGKPDPEGYRRGLEALNAAPPLPERLLHPHEVLAVEDTPAGLEAARSAGLVTLALAHSYPAERLQADRVLDTIAHLTPRELLRIAVQRV